MKAYAVDAMEQASGTSKLDSAKVKEWLRVASDAPSELFESPEVGDDVRNEGHEKVGAYLVVHGYSAHMEMFSDDEIDGAQALQRPIL